MNKKISIVIPTWNCENEIGSRYLDKLLSQDYSNWECICVDNSPSEHTLLVLNEYAKKDSRILVRTSEKNNATLARNTGIELTTGDFVWVVDCDDELMFDRTSLGELLEILEAYSCDITMLPCEQYVNGRKNEAHYMRRLVGNPNAGKVFCIDEQKDMDLCGLVKTMYYPPWCKVFKGGFLRNSREIRFQGNKWGDDWMFSYQAYNSCQTFAIAKCGVVYRQHSHCSSSSTFDAKVNSVSSIATTLAQIACVRARNIVFADTFLGTRIEKVERDLGKMLSIRKTPREKLIGELVEGLSVCSDIDKLAMCITSKQPILNAAISQCCKMMTPESTSETNLAESAKLPSDRSFIGNSDIFGYSDKDAKHDILFILGTGSTHEDAEIMYAMCAARKFCSSWLRDIFVVGAKPRSWNAAKQYKFTWLECNDPYPNKDANIIYKVKFAIENLPELSDSFLICSDDSLPIKESTWEDFRPRQCRIFDPNDKKFYNVCNRGGGGWLGNLYTTLSRYVGMRDVVRYFQPHCWTPVEKVSFLRMCNDMEWKNRPGNIIKSLYYNYIGFPDPQGSEDVVFKVTPPSAAFCNSLGKDKKIRIVSYNDNAFNLPAFRAAIRRILEV